MKATKEYVERRFAEFNRLMFGGRLPLPPVRLSDAGSFLGQCVSKSRRLPDGHAENYDFELRINTRYDLPEHTLEDVIIHEMIHYFIAYNGLRDSSPHGRLFKALMQSINTAFNRNLSISHKLTPEQKEQAVSARRTLHVIAAVYFRSGQTGVKVLPRVVTKILDYDNKARRHPDVRQVEYYLHDNPYFNRYPTSAALRVHDIDPATLKENLSGARRLRLDGNRIIVCR